MIKNYLIIILSFLSICLLSNNTVASVANNAPPPVSLCSLCNTDPPPENQPSPALCLLCHNTPPVRLCSLCNKITTLHQSIRTNIDLGGNYSCWNTVDLDAQRDFCAPILSQCRHCTETNNCLGQESLRSIEYYRNDLQNLNLWSIIHSTCLQRSSENCREIYNRLINLNCRVHYGECQNSNRGLEWIVEQECNTNSVNCAALKRDIARLNCSPKVDNDCRSQIGAIVNSSCQPANSSCVDLDWPRAAVAYLSTDDNPCPSYVP